MTVQEAAWRATPAPVPSRTGPAPGTSAGGEPDSPGRRGSRSAGSAGPTCEVERLPVSDALALQEVDGRLHLASALHVVQSVLAGSPYTPVLPAHGDDLGGQTLQTILFA